MSQTVIRILAIDPMHRGLGFVVFELPFHLVEWGIARVKGDKNAGAMSRFEKLLIRFRVDAVILEDVDDPSCRRRPRTRHLVKAFAQHANARGIMVHTVARSAVLRCFAPVDGRATKHMIAKKLVEYFPELAKKLPPHRKIYESEHERMSIFDALAFAVTYANR